MRILVVEDSFILADTLASQFEKEHFLVDIAYDGKQGYDLACTGIYDAAVLDLMLPELNGFQVLEKLRKNKNNLPIIVLSAKSELDDKVLAFDYGADDYLTKPFKFKELLMRIRAISRRQNTDIASMLTCGDLRLDLNTCTLSNKENERSIRLSGKEFQLLEYLMSNQKQIISREQIVGRIWGYDSNAEYNNVEVYISFLRKKITFIGSGTHIRAIRGVGYTMEAEN